MDAAQYTLLKRAQVVVFVSQAAVDHSVPWLSFCALQQKQIIAMGHATKARLSAAGLDDVMVVRAPYNSEALLADLRFQWLHRRRIIIISGETGRQLLPLVLRQRGHSVQVVPCYQRRRAHLSSQTVLEFIRQYQVNAILMTSCQIAEVVDEHLRRTELDGYRDWSVFVLSRRIRTYADKLGFTRITTASFASRSSLNQSIMTWWEASNDDKA